MSMIPMRPLGFGEIVDGALQLYRRDFGLYYLIALVGAFPGYVLLIVSGVDTAALAQTGETDPLAALAEMGVFWAVLLVAIAIAWVGTVAVAAAMADRIGQRPTSLGSAYKVAFRRLPSAAGATFVAVVISSILLTAVFLASGLVLFAFVQAGSPVLAILAGLGVLMVVAMVAAVALGATFGILPAVIIEGRRAMNALWRSISLCRGAWLRVTGIMVVAMIINIAPSIGTMALFGMGDLFVSPDALGEISSTRQWLMNTIDLVIGPLTTPFMVGSMMVLFHDRRVRSEAFDLETLAGAMDGR